MIINRSPKVKTNSSNEVTISGDTLTVEGVSFDFSALNEGETLHKSAVGSDVIVGDVSRIDSVITTTILWFSEDEYASYEDRFPTPFTPADGPVGSVGEIDWTKVKTATDKHNETLVEVVEIAADLAEAGKITWDEAIAWTAGTGVPAASTTEGRDRFDLAKAKSVRLDNTVFPDVGMSALELKTLLASKANKG
jgi:hypothetical protein